MNYSKVKTEPMKPLKSHLM